MNAVVETITPDIAAKMLETNVHNRAFSSALSMRYARDMSEGRWRLNGEPIIFAKTNKLLDGQHRLYGVLESGVSIESLVVRGVDEDAFATINTGSTRRGKDVLSIVKGVNPLVAAATCKFCLRHSHNPDLLVQTAAIATNDEILAFYAGNKQQIDIGTEIGCRLKLKRLVPPTVCAFLVVQTFSTAREKMEKFLGSLETGEGLEGSSPVYVLRERLLREKDKQARLRTEYILALVIKAWNAYINNRPLLKLFFGPDKESFPTIETTPADKKKK
jgi:hypothetical protein